MIWRGSQLPEVWVGSCLQSSVLKCSTMLRNSCLPYLSFSWKLFVHAWRDFLCIFMETFPRQGCPAVAGCERYPWGFFLWRGQVRQMDCPSLQVPCWCEMYRHGWVGSWCTDHGCFTASAGPGGTSCWTVGLTLACEHHQWNGSWWTAFTISELFLKKTLRVTCSHPQTRRD